MPEPGAETSIEAPKLEKLERADALVTEATLTTLAQLAGVKLYDDTTRAVVTPEQHRAAAYDKQAWDRNYALKWIKGGSAALSLTDIERAMRSPIVGTELDISETLTL